jgi:hypothetical protein
MSRELIESWRSVLRLFRFVFWYAIAVAGMFYLLPLVGALAESRYDELSGSAKLLSAIGFFGVIGAWQALGERKRMRKPMQSGSRRRAGLS